MTRNRILLLGAVIVIILITAGVSLAKKGESGESATTTSSVGSIIRNIFGVDQKDDSTPTNDKDGNGTDTNGNSGGKGNPDLPPPPPPAEDGSDTYSGSGRIPHDPIPPGGGAQANDGCYIGGCSGQICSDKPGAISTCEWRDSYACYKTARCERQTGGQCGWTMTSELRQCLDGTRDSAWTW